MTSEQLEVIQDYQGLKWRMQSLKNEEDVGLKQP